MKGQGFFWRLKYALAGFVHALREERSFRTHALAALAVLATLVWLRPPWGWVALCVAMIGLVMALELVNTALEQTLDGLHPHEAEFVRQAKDCAAAAVLVASLCAAAVFVLMLVALFAA